VPCNNGGRKLFNLSGSVHFDMGRISCPNFVQPTQREVVRMTLKKFAYAAPSPSKPTDKPAWKWKR